MPVASHKSRPAAAPRVMRRRSALSAGVEPTVASAPGDPAEPARRPPAAQQGDQRGHPEQQRAEHLQAQTLARQRSDADKQACGRRRRDRYVVALGLGGGRKAAIPAEGDGIAARRLAGDAVVAVEHERRIPGAAVGRTDREGAVMRWECERGGQPRERHRDVDSRGGGHLQQPPPARPRQGQVGEQRETGQRDERLQQLYVERQSQSRGGEQQPGDRAALGRPHDQQQAEHDERHHHRVHGVAARGEHLDRQDGHGRGCREAGTNPEQPADNGEQQRDRGGPGERLGQLERGRVEAEQLHAGHLQPQVDRRLVDRDAPAGLERAEEEVVPGQAMLRTAAS